MGDLARYSLKDVAVQNGKEGNRTWIVIHDLVYDVTDYMDKHPGGPELIEEFAGQDATKGFDDFGHSSDAKRMLKSYLVGELIDEDKMSARRKNGTKLNGKSTTARGERRRFLSVLCGKCVA